MSLRNHHYFYLLLLCLLAVLIFFVNNFALNGYLGNYEQFALELWTAPGNLAEWESSHHPPYKYRFLFAAIVKGTYYAFFHPSNAAFYYTYLGYSLLFLLASVVAFYYLVRACRFDHSYAFFGSCIYLMCPAILMAYTLPVHLKEDTLAFFLLSLGLLCILKSWHLLFLVVAGLGVSCRETLLILPFVYLFFTEADVRFKVLAVILPFIGWVSLLYHADFTGYGALDMGMRYNLENPLQSIFFLFVTFWFLWLPFVFQIVAGIFKWKQISSPQLPLIEASLPWVFLLVFSTTFLGGRFNEIRIMFLLFPWVVIVSLQFFKGIRSYFIEYLHKPAFYLYCIPICVLILWIGQRFLLNNVKLVGYDYAYGMDISNQWLVVFLVTLMIYVVFLPASIRYMSFTIKKR